MKHTDIKLKTLQDKDLILFIENFVRGGISSVISDRYKKTGDNEKIIYVVATSLYGPSMSQMLPYDKSAMWRGDPDLYNNKLEEILNTPDDNAIVYFVEIESKYPHNQKEKIKNFVLKIKYVIKMILVIIQKKPDTYTQNRKLSFDWTKKRSN